MININKYWYKSQHKK